MKLRKILSLLLIATLFVGITSCSKDDDKFSTPDSIIGDWKYVTYNIDYKTSNAAAETAIKNMIKDPKFIAAFNNAPEITTFNQDGTYLENGVEEGKYTYAKGKLTITNEDSSAISADVTAKGNTLRITSNILEELKKVAGFSNPGITKLDLTITYQKK